MHVALLVFGLWIALDILLVVFCLAQRIRGDRLQAQVMVDAAERYANVARPAHTELTHR